MQHLKMYDMSHDQEIIGAIKTMLSDNLDIISIQGVGGGSISRAYAIETSKGEYFLKANHDSTAMAMFEAEMDGLSILAQSSTFSIPAVYGVEKINGTAFLLMDLIESTARNRTYWQELAVNLAELHQTEHEQYGYSRANFIGSLPQTNDFSSTWREFFINQRMYPMIRLARDKGLVDADFVVKFDSAIPKIVSLMPIESPSLVHGDLWSGNLMVDATGRATIIDPAVYFGHREMDLAFSQMFGGFSQEFLDAYNETYPLEPGFSERIGLYNLYPYLVHLNLFGRSYFGHIDATVRRFT